MRRRNGSPDNVTPLGAARFGVVVETIERDGAAAGFRRARNLMFESFETLSGVMPAYAVLKLAVEFDRHSQMCDIYDEKARAHGDAEIWDRYQRYLAGEVDVAPAVGIREPLPEAVASADGVTVRVNDLDDLPSADLDESVLDEPEASHDRT